MYCKQQTFRAKKDFMNTYNVLNCMGKKRKSQQYNVRIVVNRLW